MKKHMEMVERRLGDGLELWHEYMNEVTLMGKWLKYNEEEDEFHRVPIRCESIVEAEKWRRKVLKNEREGV